MTKTQNTSIKTLPPLYIIHGWTYSVEPWTTTLDLLKKSGVEVKMLNVPGLTSPSEKVWTIKDYVSWANKTLPDHAVVLGHSNGGRILLNLLSKHPNRLRHLILLDSAGIYEPSKKRDVLQKISKLGAPLKRLPLARKIFHKILGASDYSRAPENMKTTLTNMLESDKLLDISKISTSTSILWGEADTVTPPRQAQKLHSLLKNSTLKLFPDWTHAPYISHPAELASAILDVLEKEVK